MIIYKNGLGAIVTNKSAFAREYGLNYQLLMRLLKGEIKQHKGWALENVENTPTSFTLYDVNGVEYSFTNKSAFAKEHGLNYNSVLKLLKGDVNSHKGWTLEDVEIEVEKLTLYDDLDVPHTFTNKSAFAKKYGLNYSSLFKLLKGEIKQHKGWTLNPINTNDSLIDPEGVERVVFDLKAFCKLYDLPVIDVKRILTGGIRSFNGWTIKLRN